MQTVQVSRLEADGLAGSYHTAFVIGAVVSALAVLWAARIVVPARGRVVQAA
jgi:hypothetical protein